MNIARLIFAVFAVYGTTFIVVREDGPFNVFSRWRATLGRWAALKPPHGLAATIAEIFNCTICMGVWLSALIAPLILFHTYIGDIIILVLGIAGMQSFLTRLTEINHEDN